jgi:hypothetical protein
LYSASEPDHASGLTVSDLVEIVGSIDFESLRRSEKSTDSEVRYIGRIECLVVTFLENSGICFFRASALLGDAALLLRVGICFACAVRSQAGSRKDGWKLEFADSSLEVLLQWPQQHGQGAGPLTNRILLCHDKPRSNDIGYNAHTERKNLSEIIGVPGLAEQPGITEGVPSRLHEGVKAPDLLFLRNWSEMDGGFRPRTFIELIIFLQV